MSELLDLIPLLIQKTKTRKLTWQASGTSVWVRFGQNAILIDTGVDEDLDLFHTLELRNSEGNVIDSIRRWQLAEDDVEDSETTLRYLYDNARRSALKIDEIIDDVRNKLRDL